MPSFAQTHSRVTSYYILQDKQDILKQLVHAARWKKPVLIVPARHVYATCPSRTR